MCRETLSTPSVAKFVRATDRRCSADIRWKGGACPVTPRGDRAARAKTPRIHGLWPGVVLDGISLLKLKCLLERDKVTDSDKEEIERRLS